MKPPGLAQEKILIFPVVLLCRRPALESVRPEPHKYVPVFPAVHLNQWLRFVQRKVLCVPLPEDSRA